MNPLLSTTSVHAPSAEETSPLDAIADCKDRVQATSDRNNQLQVIGREICSRIPVLYADHGGNDVTMTSARKKKKYVSQ